MKEKILHGIVTLAMLVCLVILVLQGKYSSVPFPIIAIIFNELGWWD